MALIFSEFFTSLRILIQSFWFSFEGFLNFFNQNNGFSKICLQDWLMSLQIFKCSVSKFQKIFSARCWRPGLLIIFSIKRWYLINLYLLVNWFGKNWIFSLICSNRSTSVLLSFKICVNFAFWGFCTFHTKLRALCNNVGNFSSNFRNYNAMQMSIYTWNQILLNL